MKTQVDLEKFRKKIEQLSRHIEIDAQKVDAAPVDSQPHRNHDIYHRVAASVLKQLIEPRVELVAGMFEGASVEVNADVAYVRLSFLSPRLSSRFYLLFCLRLDHSERMVRLYAECCLRPFTLDYESSSSLGIPLNSSNLKQVETFVEDQILKFLKGYLKSHHEDGVESEVLPP